MCGQTPSSRRQSARLAVKRKVLADKSGNSSKVLNSTGNTIQVLNGFSSNSNKNESMVVCTSYNEFAVSGIKSLAKYSFSQI